MSLFQIQMTNSLKSRCKDANTTVSDFKLDNVFLDFGLDSNTFSKDSFYFIGVYISVDSTRHLLQIM